MKKQLFPTILTTLSLCAAALALLLFPRETSQAVRDGLVICGDTLLPSLFPFFVLSALIVKLGLSQLLGKALEPIMQPLFRLPGICSTALVLGMIGGYPTGARTAVTLYKDGQCSRREVQQLLAFCNNCGPAFLLGAVGSGLFGNPTYGLLLAGVHFIAAILTGIILNRSAPKAVSHIPASFANQKSIPLSAAFVDSVTDALQALLNLFAFVLCFSAITQLVQLSGVPDFLSGILFPFLSEGNGRTLLLGLLEMTCGVVGLDSGNTAERLILTSALLGWGGLSVHCQVLSLLRDTDLSPAPYFKGKALHALLSAVLMTAVLWQIDAVCLLAGAGLLFFPTRMAKKSSGKSAKSIL